MSDVDSSTEGSLPHSPRILGSKLSRDERALFTQDGWDDLLGGWSEDGKYKAIRGLTQQTSARSRSMDSDESSATRHSSVILGPRGSGFRNLDVVPIKSTPPRSHLRVISSPSSRVSSNTRMNSPYGASHGRSNFLTEDVSPTQLQRPPSPRSQINKFQAENPSVRITTHSSPMDKFLLQFDERAGFRHVTLEEWKKLRSIRAKVFRLRSRLQSKRKALHEKQLAKSTADEAFMKYVRSNRSATTDPAEAPSSPFTPAVDMDAYYEAMQVARDDYGEAENDYNSLEEALDESEYELAKLEGRFYNSEEHDVLPNPDSESDAQVAGSITSSPTSLLGMSSDHEDHYHPLQFSYLSRLGDLDLAKERHHNMGLQRDKLLSNQMSRMHLGIELHESEKVFLAEFPKLEEELRREIAEIEEDVERWKARCLAEGVDISEDNNLSDEESNETGYSNSNYNPTPDSGTLQKSGVVQDLKTESSYSMFSLLLPASIKGKVALRVLITEFDENNKGDRISRWMLHKLCTSPLDADLLGRVFLNLLNLFNFRQWRTDLLHFQQSVLFLWERDEAHKPPAAFKTLQTSTFSGQRDRVMPQGGKYASTTNRASIESVWPGNAVRRIRSAPGSFDLGRKILKAPEASIALPF
jgi:hypothetical protein